MSKLLNHLFTEPIIYRTTTILVPFPQQKNFAEKFTTTLEKNHPIGIHYCATLLEKLQLSPRMESRMRTNVSRLSSGSIIALTVERAVPEIRLAPQVALRQIRYGARWNQLLAAIPSQRAGVARNDWPRIGRSYCLIAAPRAVPRVVIGIETWTRGRRCERNRWRTVAGPTLSSFPASISG